MNKNVTQGKFLIVQGAQWGSEGKGQVTALLAGREGDACVRTGSINAGHTVYYDNKEYKMQQIPTAWVVDDMPLFIGAGAYIHPDILAREINMIKEATGEDIRERLYIDYRCFIHSSSAEQTAKDANRHVQMGATGKGSSEAIIEKLRSRGDFDHAKRLRFRKWASYYGDIFADLIFADVAHEIMDLYNEGQTIVFEGTQGAHLDLHLGDHPFVSNRSANAATWLQEVGLSPACNTEVVLVARTFPIRVAGNSGGMKEEISWPDLWMKWNETLSGQSKEYVPEEAICFYQEKMNKVFKEMISKENEFHPDLSDQEELFGWSPHLFSDEQKLIFREELSEVPMRAWKALPTPIQEELRPFIEMTTVTKKPRRIARFSMEVLEDSILWNQPDRLFLGFVNYLNPSLWDTEDLDVVANEPQVYNLVSEIESRGVEVCGFSTGANPKYHLFK